MGIQQTKPISYSTGLKTLVIIIHDPCNVCANMLVTIHVRCAFLVMKMNRLAIGWVLVSL